SSSTRGAAVPARDSAVLHNVAKGSPKRAAFEAMSGRMMVPYLIDPNTGASMFESAAIVAYLRETYGA
ncbi:MAG: glutathione S-transferase N-terminal domain-containing protein, partial [Deltaproteobacteria bacterium]|nr:glutathione S-transferase N-terminal domain-containing protein [Deltaproteobacteria bacterium]